MPFIGCLDGDRVIPEEVADGETVDCLECGGELFARGPFSDGRVRHFAHQDQQINCSGHGSESETHQKLKSFAVSALQQSFDGEYSRCGPELDVEVPDTETLLETRRADVLLEFTSENLYYGKGIIIEVQYKNDSKDKFATTHDYLSRGFSAFWADPSDFENDELRFTVVEQAFADDDNNDGIAVYDNDADDFSTEITTSLQWNDPTTDCSHTWRDMEQHGQTYQSCSNCGLNRMYSTKHTRYLYDNRELLGPATEQQSSNSGCGPKGKHAWEPSDGRTSRCMRCGARQVEGVSSPYEEDLVLPMYHSGSDLSELNSDPSSCSHNWRDRGTEYQCSNCGVIDSMPY